MINLILIFQNLEYESIEYLNDIQRHYRITQIYKLSQDTKIAVDRFLSSINIQIGYSAIIAWIAFGLAIIDGIILLFTCKIKHNEHENETKAIPNDSHTPPPPQMPVIDNFDENISYDPTLENERYPPPRTQYEDEV
jgi:hypothetical protein